MQYLFTYSKTSHHLFFSSVSCNIAFFFFFLILWFILLKIQMSSNFSCGEKASLYTLSLLVCFSYSFYTLKPSSLKESCILSVSSFSHQISELTPENCSYTISAKLLLSKSSTNSILLKRLINSYFSSPLTFQQHLLNYSTFNHSLHFDADASLSLEHNTFGCFFSIFLVLSSQCFY